MAGSRRKVKKKQSKGKAREGNTDPHAPSLSLSLVRALSRRAVPRALNHHTPLPITLACVSFVFLCQAAAAPTPPAAPAPAPAMPATAPTKCASLSRRATPRLGPRSPATRAP